MTKEEYLQIAASKYEELAALEGEQSILIRLQARPILRKLGFTIKSRLPIRYN